VAVNETLKDRPELINKAPYEGGWIVIIEMSKPKEVERLMTAAQYEQFLQNEAH
jgi:glycine cleavage system H protein